MASDLRNLRSRRVIRTAFLLAFSVFAQVAAFGQEAASLPDGEGRDLMATQCVACHPLSTVLFKRASRDVWAETIARMVTTYMAPINDADRELIVGYLSANYGEDSSHNLGQQMLAEQCFRCHGEGMWSDLKTDRAGWVSVLYRMIGRGARWTSEQMTVMADYLADTYPAGGSE